MNPILIQDIAARIDKVLGAQSKPVQLHEPKFVGNESRYVDECIKTGWVSSVGKFVDRFERDLSDFTNSKYAIATVNGTAALHICLKLVGVVANDEVLVPALSFVATANAVAYCGAIPHFVDSDYLTLGVDPSKLSDYLGKVTEKRIDGCFNRQTGRRISALVPMHTFGQPVDLDAISEICDRFGIEIVEDAAESLGSLYKGQHTGTRGRVAALSFNGNKIVTTGGGGAILTQSAALAKRAKHLTTTARASHGWTYFHDEVGYNFRMPNINAALGCAQLESLPTFVEKKRVLAQKYVDAFRDFSGGEILVEPSFARSNYWLNALVLGANNAASREAVLVQLNSRGILVRPAWALLSTLPMYLECPKMDLSQAQSIESRLISLPSSPFLLDC